MTNGVQQAEAVRAALEGLPDGTSYGDETPTPAQVYFPQSHSKALHPDVAVVTGIRGAGKTFWWSALQEPEVRQLIGERHERAQMSEETELRTGFGSRADIHQYPSKDVLKQILDQDLEARLAWRTVQAWQLAPKEHPFRRQPDWVARTCFVRDHPEPIDRMFAERDEQLAHQGRRVVVIFDALDRSADDWRTMYRLIRGLLQTALDMRSYRRIRVKMFLRSDQFAPASIGDFPDASKLLSSAVELTWPRQELYGLLWHLLANAPNPPAAIRELVGGGESGLFGEDDCGVRQFPPDLVFDEGRQRRTFHTLAGEWMGKGPRRGFPYTWIPNHLGDVEGKVSPRSFIAALRAAAEDSRARHPHHDYSLHYDSIKLGVQKASKIRVEELREDYPWVHRLLQDLQGMVVPSRFRDIEQRWEERQTLRQLRHGVEQQDVKLPPSRIDDGAEGVRGDLEALSVFQRMHDGRVNIPDVFRVGYGLGRRGGVRAVR